jgi:hypothetical protein
MVAENGYLPENDECLEDSAVVIVGNGVVAMWEVTNPVKRKYRLGKLSG